MKTSYLDLYVSHVTIHTEAQTSVQPVHSKSTDEIFADDALADNPHGDEDTIVQSQMKTVMDNTHHPDVQLVEEKDENIQ
nr:hypothetical protein CFP56_59269 [Quercus suber]